MYVKGKFIYFMFSDQVSINKEAPKTIRSFIKWD